MAELKKNDWFLRLFSPIGAMQLTFSLASWVLLTWFVLKELADLDTGLRESIFWWIVVIAGAIMAVYLVMLPILLFRSEINWSK